MKYVFPLLFVLCATAPALADPTACTSTPSAVVSHFVTHNNDYGGHVNAHVLGQVPPHGYSQAGKTMFSNADVYEHAWERLAAEDPPLYCSEFPQIGHEAARSIALHLVSAQCTAANVAGICTRHHDIDTYYVRWVFRAVEKSPGSVGAKWILYDAYPSRYP